MSDKRVRHQLSALLLLAFLAKFVTAQTCVTPSSGLVSWWPADGNANDIVGSNNGILGNAVVFLTGEVGLTFGFAGAPASGVIASGITVPHLNGSLDLSTVTMEGWVLINQLPLFTGESCCDWLLATKGATAENYGLYIRNVNGTGTLELEFEYYNTAYSGSYHGFTRLISNGSGLTLHQFHHVAVTADGSFVKFYVDGRFVSQEVQPGPLQPNADPFQIATNAPFHSGFDGSIDEWSVYRRALDASEIQAIAQAGSAGKCRGFSVTTITPSHGGNAGTVTMQVLGSGFQGGATVKLVGLGQDILGTNTTLPNTSILRTTFDLTGATPGVRNVVITNLNGSTATLSNGFTVEQGGAAQVSVNIIGLDKIRIGAGQTYYLVCGNSGNVDAAVIQCWVSFPASLQWSTLLPANASLSSTSTSSGDLVLGIDAIGVGADSSIVVPLILKTSATNSFALSAWSNQQ